MTLALRRVSPPAASALHGCLPVASGLLRRRIVPSTLGVENVMESALVAKVVVSRENLTR